MMVARRRYASLDNMKFPAGRKRGVRPEPIRNGYRLRGIESIRRISNLIIPDQFWDELCQTAAHKYQRERIAKPIYDQNSTGSCAAESANGGLNAIASRMGQPLVLFNPLFVYHTTSGGRDNGSVIGDNVNFLLENGACPEEIWPRHKGFRAKPSSEAYEIAEFFKLLEAFYVETVAEFVSALLKDYVIHFGYSGHAVLADRYLGKGRIEYKNSWGNWGDEGFGTLSTRNIYFPYGAYAYQTMSQYAAPNDGGGWDWLCPWEPKHDQTMLAEGVAAYEKRCMQKTKARSARWVSDNDAWREDEYNACMAKVGLSV
jgi:hypothetical protein